jgi:hypothetical protein
MTFVSPEDFRRLLPLACEWAEAQGQHILTHGVALSPERIADAKIVGVAHPDRVRLLRVPGIPVGSDGAGGRAC